MVTDTQNPTPGTREHFLRVTQLRCWGTIQEYVELCRAQGYFTPTFYATAIAQMERIHVRRRLKQVTNAQGWPVFGNIERVGPDGTPARVPAGGAVRPGGVPADRRLPLRPGAASPLQGADLPRP